MSFQVSGLASGLDTSALIDGLMFAERATVRRLEASVGTENASLNAWSDIESKLGDLQSAITAIRTGSALEASTAATSNDAVLRATTTGTPVTGQYTFRVDSLAAAQQVSSAAIGDGTTLVGAGTAEISGGFASIGSELDSHTLTDGTYTVTIVSIDEDAQAAEVSFDGVTSTVSTASGSFTVTGDSGGSVTVNEASGSSFSVGSASISIVEADASTTVANLVTSLNAAGGPVRAQLIDTGDGSSDPYRLVLTAQNTGVAHAADIDLSGLSLFSGGLTTLRAASDASLSLGGGGLTITRASNSFSDVIDGVTIDLVGTSPDDDVDITVSADVDARVDAVTNVVDTVSDILGQLRTYSAYDTETNQGGPLVGSFTARTVSSELSTAMGTVVASSSLALLSQIGITTQNDGTYALDETALRNALADDPAAVETLLLGDPAVDDDGVLDAMSTTVEALLATSGRIPTAKETAENNISALESQIQNQEVRLEAVEERYLRQFTALESLIGQLQSQSNYLASLLGQQAPA